jgi:hypothetical protein
MVTRDSLLVALVSLVDLIPLPDPGPRRRGRPYFYSQRLFLKALLIMIVRHLHTVHSLLTVLEQPTPEMEKLRSLLCESGRYPTRRTFERRLKALPNTLPSQIACLGRHLVALLQPWANCGRAAAIDSTLLTARGGVWHKKDREQGVVPHTSIDTEAHWTKSGWHGWVYGWKLHLITTVAAIWIPLAARLTPANEADNEVAPALIADADPEARYLLGDHHYNAPNVEESCQQTGRFLVASRQGPYPHTDPGVEVRRLFHMLRSHAIENFNEQFKAIFDAHGAVPTKGLANTQRFALGAVFLYQVTLLYRHQHGLDLRVGLKPFLKAA